MIKVNQDAASCFTDLFPDLDTDDQIADQIILQKKLDNKIDPLYVATGCIKERKLKVEELWPKFKEFADREFLKDFKMNFNSRCWEMYLANLLCDSFHLSASKNNHGPDLILNSRILLEAAVCKHGEGANKVPECYIANYALAEPLLEVEYPHQQILLRITSLITDKLRQYQQWLDTPQLIGSEQPFVIAINIGNLGYCILDNLPVIFKPLFGIGFSQYKKIDGSLVDCGFSSVPEITKTSGKSIHSHIFEDSSHEQISAIIFSETPVSLHSEEMGQDCIIVHNPCAINPINNQEFSFLTQWIVRGDEVVCLPPTTRTND